MSQRYEFTSFGLGETTQDGFLGTEQDFQSSLWVAGEALLKTQSNGFSLASP